jgi:hypothetical protein
MSDLDRVRVFMRPLAGQFGWPVRGMIESGIDALTAEQVRRWYRDAGGEEAVHALAGAVIRIGEGEGE